MKEQTLFTAKIKYNLENITRLSKRISRTFRFLPRSIMYLVCMLIILYSLFFVNNSSVSVPLLAVASIAMANLSAPDKKRAGDAYRAVGSKDVVVDYEFYDSFFMVHARQDTKVAYSELIVLGEDEGFLYLFADKNSGFMVDKTALSPDAASFKELIGNKTGLIWKRNNPLIDLISLVHKRNN